MGRKYWKNGVELEGKPTVKVVRGRVRMKLTNNMVFTLQLLAAGFLYESPDDERASSVKSVYETLPDRHTLSKEWTSTYDGRTRRTLPAKIHRVDFLPGDLQTISFLITMSLAGGWMQSGSAEDRIDDIEKLSALTLLALAAE